MNMVSRGAIASPLKWLVGELLSLSHWSQGSQLYTPIILVERAHLLVLIGAGHAGQVRQVARRLEVSAA